MFRRLLITLALFCGLVTPAAAGSSTWTVTKSEWSEEDEKGYSAFIQKIGESNCETPDDCINSDANPYRGTDGRGLPAMRCAVCHQNANFDPGRVPAVHQGLVERGPATAERVEPNPRARK